MCERTSIEWMFTISCILFLGLINVFNFITFIEESVYIWIIPMIFIIAGLYFLVRHIKIRPVYFALIILFMSFFLKAVIAIVYNAPQKSDFLNIYNAALKAAKGDFSFSANGYFSLWAYQTGIVAFYSFVVKVFGGCMLVPKIINCMFMAGSNTILYLLSKRLVSDSYARLIALVYLIYPAPYFLASVLTNQHISNFLFLLGVFIYTSEHKSIVLRIVMSAVPIAVGNALRPQGIVVVFAVVGTLLLEVMYNLKNRTIAAKSIVSAVSFLIIYILLMQGLSFGVKATNLNKSGLANNFPLYKFVVGLNYKTNGSYSQDDVNAYVSIRDHKLRDEKAAIAIRDRLSDPGHLSGLLINKQKAMWASLDDSIDWGFDYLRAPGINILGRNVTYPFFRFNMQKLEKIFYTFIILLATLGLLLKNGNVKGNRVFLIMLFVIFTNFFAYTLVEIQSRYRDFQLIFLFLAAAVGSEAVGKLFISHIRNKTRGQKAKISSRQF